MEVYRLVDGHYEPLPANDRNHYPIAPLGVELGIKVEGGIPWLRWWDDSGNLLLTGDERAFEAEGRVLEAEAIANQERFAKEQAEEKAARLAEKLRLLGIDPDEA